jgi:hypothetical protein
MIFDVLVYVAYRKPGMKVKTLEMRVRDYHHISYTGFGIDS